MSFVLLTYRIEIDNNYQLDLRNSEFDDLIGFKEKILNKTEYGSRLLNITNSIHMIHINTDAMTNSLLNGVNTNTLAIIPTVGLTRSYSFTIEPRRLLFNEVSQLHISQMQFHITHSIACVQRSPISFVDWFITVILRSTPN